MSKTVSLKFKLDQRGGQRVKKSNLSPQSMLLEAIWNKHGGATKVAELIHEIPQALVNWKLRGQVPLEKVLKVSEALNVSPYALNYTGYKAIQPTGEHISWQSVVMSCALAPEVEEAILTLSRKKPKLFKKK